jgi:hypothetical protein
VPPQLPPTPADPPSNDVTFNVLKRFYNPLPPPPHRRDGPRPKPLAPPPLQYSLPPFPDHTERKGHSPSYRLPFYIASQNFETINLGNKFVRSAPPSYCKLIVMEKVPEICGDLWGKVSERPSHPLTFSPPTYCTWPNGNIYMLFPVHKPWPELSSPTLTSITTSVPTYSPSSSSGQRLWQREFTNQPATSMRGACWRNSHYRIFVPPTL